MRTSAKYKLYPEILLLSLLCLSLFVVPLFPTGIRTYSHEVLNSFVFVACSLCLARGWKAMTIFALTLFIIQWITTIFDIEWLRAFLRSVSILFFFAIVILLISQTVRSKKVTATIILGSINGYLLLGLAFTLMAGLLEYFRPGSYHFGPEPVGRAHLLEHLPDITYFSFITLTTVGYGDFLPLNPAAKSLSILTSVTGQLYLTILVAMLVGKFISGEKG